MRSFLLFLRDFVRNKGLMVFLSILIEKVTALVNTIFVVRLIAQEDYGLITLVASLFGVFAAFNGLGASQGLLRFGSLEKEIEDKEKLAHSIFLKGLQRQLILLVFFIITALLYELKYPDIWLIVLFFAVRLIGFYFYMFIKSYYRMRNENDQFSKISITINIVGLLLVLAFTYFYGMFGYLFGLAITPWISIVFFPRLLFDSARSFDLKLDMKTFWNYSFNSALTAFLSEMLFILDVFIIGLLLNELEVANYKLAIILPMNLMFIPVIFMQTDYPKLVENCRNKQYLLFYIRNYYKLFIPLSLFFITIGFFLKDWLIGFVFGEKYQHNGWIFWIILIGVGANMCFRNLYSNLLSAVGWAQKNTIVAVVSILMMTILGFIFTYSFGIVGAAIALTITFTSMGIFSAFLFSNYLKQLS